MQLKQKRSTAVRDDSARVGVVAPSLTKNADGDAGSLRRIGSAKSLTRFAAGFFDEASDVLVNKWGGT